MGKVQVPNWIESPKQISIRCEKITKIEGTQELLIHIKINGDDFTIFLPEENSPVIDISNQTIKANLVATFNEDYLVDLPVDTLTSGPRIRIPKAQIPEVVIEK